MTLPAQRTLVARAGGLRGQVRLGEKGAAGNAAHDGLTAAGRMKLAEARVAQAMAGHFPSREAVARSERVLRGELTHEQARAEILAKYLPS